MGLFNDKQISQTPGGADQQGPRGPQGVGFKMTSHGNYDMDNKILFNVKTQDDVPDDSNYNTIKKDYESAVNKEYLKNNFLKRDSKTQTFFDLKGYSIQNSEVYDPNSWNDKTITNKQYVDMKDDLKADKTELNKKADLETSDEQTFKGILNVPDFDPGYSNMTNVMNKKYIDQKLDMKTNVVQSLKSRLQVPNFDINSNNERDVPNIKYLSSKYLNKEAGGQLQNSILFNSFHTDSKRQIYYLGNPLYDSSATNKAYVDSEIQKVTFNTSSVVLIDGSHIMTGDLDMGNNKIISLEKPTNDTDGVNKKYLEDHVGVSHIQSANAENKFKYIMNDHDEQLSEEDDVKLGNIVTYQNSPHQINKKVVDMKLLIDSSKGYYSSRVGLNLYPLSNGEYTVCFELMWLNDNIDPNSLQIDGSSSIETIHNVNRKTFKTQKYVRLICQFTKSQNIGNNYLYIDVVIKMKSGSSYDQELQTYFTVYGISGHQSNIDKNIYDSFMNFENDEINFEKSIDMNDNLIIGVKNADRDKAAVNLKQVTDLLNNHFSALISQINTKQNKSNYQLIFEYFFDLQNPDSFDMENSYGSNIKSVGGKLMLKNIVSLSDYNVKDGFSINLAYIQLDEILDQNDDFTLFVSFLYDNSLTGQNYSIGFADNSNNISQHNVTVTNNKIIIREDDYFSYQTDIISAYKDKHVMLWFCKKNNIYRAIICQGNHINSQISTSAFQANRVVIHLPYKIQRIGFSKKSYNLYDKEFHNISFLEKANGVFFE